MNEIEKLFSNFPQNIRALRESDGLTQSELAKAMKMQPNQLKRIETGETKSLKSHILGRFSIYFDVSTDEILRGQLTDVKPTQDRVIEDFISKFGSEHANSAWVLFRDRRNSLLGSVETPD